jgi:tetratricopeptide (TPR) repeat protein
MGKVIRFPFQAKPKFELKKVRRRKKDPGQLDLFEQVGSGANVRSIHGVFEEALIHDRKNEKDTEELYWKAIKEGDCAADAFCNLGILEYNAGHKAKAIERFTSALKEDPRHFESHYNIGNLYFDVENYQLAIFHYQVALEIQPEFSAIYYNLSLALASTQKMEEAIHALEKYLEFEDTPEGHDLLAKFIQLRSIH